jgi:tetrahydromethanopterin:alpha-L-glutamate ligase
LSNPSAKVVIATDSTGWQGEQLRGAFQRYGVEAVVVSLRDCHFDTTLPLGLRVPGFEHELPRGVFVRQVPGGTLEQVVLRLDFLHALNEAGVCVYNDGRAIERTVDKAMTTWLLHRAGVPTPPAWVAESATHVRTVVARETGEGHELVVKPLFGSQGKGLMRVRSLNELPAPESFAGVYYLQRFLPPDHGGFRDWRVMVVAGRAIAAMERHGANWINNVAQGAKCVAVPAEGTLARLSEAACAAVKVHYAGVDLMRDPRGELQVIEVNGIPAWQGLQSVCEFNIAQRLVADFLSRC